MSCQILDPGLLTTVQDRGRFGFQKYGVCVGGGMDLLALRTANALVGNGPADAALEITMSGPRVRALDKCLVAVTGAQFALRVNDQPVPMNTALFLRPGAVLEFGARLSGARAYLALAGGIDVPLVLNSRATDVRGGFGGLDGRALRVGDVINPRTRVEHFERAGNVLPEALVAYYEQAAPIHVLWGPHEEFFGEAARAAFTENEFAVSEVSDRMALRLHGPSIERAERELLSCGVPLGAIQVPPDGQPIVLMADHQTTGGYPVIATAIRADLPRLAQKIAGAKISFHALTRDEAWRAAESMLALLALIP